MNTMKHPSARPARTAWRIRKKSAPPYLLCATANDALYTITMLTPTITSTATSSPKSMRDSFVFTAPPA